jgi:hypothetical protein
VSETAHHEAGHAVIAREREPERRRRARRTRGRKLNSRLEQIFTRSRLEFVLLEVDGFGLGCKCDGAILDLGECSATYARFKMLRLVPEPAGCSDAIRPATQPDIPNSTSWPLFLFRSS